MLVFSVNNKPRWHIWKDDKSMSLCKIDPKHEIVEEEYSQLTHGRKICSPCLMQAYKSGMVDIFKREMAFSEKIKARKRQ